MLEFEGGYNDPTGTGIRANYQAIDPSGNMQMQPISI